MGKCALLGTLLCAGLGLGAAVAAGQDSVALDSEAKAEFEKGKALFHEGKFEEAADAFREANRRQPSWRLLYNIGQCEAAAKRYGQAIEAFESYLSQGGDEAPRERQDEVLVELDRLRKMTGVVMVDGDDGIDLYEDSELRGTTPLTSGVLVSVGVPHEFKLVSKGEVLLVRTDTVRGGTPLILKVEKAAPQFVVTAVTAPVAAPVVAPVIASAPAPAPVVEEKPKEPEPRPRPPQPPPPEPSPTPSTPEMAESGRPSALFWVGFAGTIVAGGLTGYFGYAAGAAADDFEKYDEAYVDAASDSDAATYDSKRRSAADDVKLYDGLTVGLGAATGALALGTIIVLAVNLGDDGSEDKTVAAAPGGIAVRF